MRSGMTHRACDRLGLTSWGLLRSAWCACREYERNALEWQVQPMQISRTGKKPTRRSGRLSVGGSEPLPTPMPMSSDGGKVTPGAESLAIESHSADPTPKAQKAAVARAPTLSLSGLLDDGEEDMTCGSVSDYDFRSNTSTPSGRQHSTSPHKAAVVKVSLPSRQPRSSSHTPTPKEGRTGGAAGALPTQSGMPASLVIPKHVAAASPGSPMRRSQRAASSQYLALPARHCYFCWPARHC